MKKLTALTVSLILSGGSLIGVTASANAAPLAPAVTANIAMPMVAGDTVNLSNKQQIIDTFNGINAFRASKGLAPVNFNGTASEVAEDWSDQMASTKTFYHNPNYTKDTRVAGRWTDAGEIIAARWDTKAQGLVDQWINSPGHNAIMSDPNLKTVGIGIAKTGNTNYSDSKNYTMYGTVNFFNLHNPPAGQYATAQAFFDSKTTTPAPTPAPVSAAEKAIAAKYAQNTGLGAKTSGVVTGLKNGGAYQNYQKGSIIWSPTTGAKVSMGAIRTKWASTGYENGGLGYPTTDEVVTVNGGVYQNYERGAIVWSPTTGARVSFGGIRTNWLASGAEKGIMGFPTSDETVSVNGGVWQNYQGGAILWHPTTGAKASSNGLIRDTWLSSGAERGGLGYPTSEKTGGLKNGGMYQNFQKGAIVYSPATGAKISMGGIRTAWAKQGYENGRLGYPTTNERVVNGTVVQDYQGGKITWTAAKGGVITYK